jgi:2-amino-4-hydroxy-6-hydroxymethyldihydropteridine diphosphokinase
MLVLSALKIYFKFKILATRSLPGEGNMPTVWLGLGSNLGNPSENISKAMYCLSEFITDLRVSRFWHSRARYVTDQPDFVNAVATGLTDLRPQDLLKSINDIESSLGRDRARSGDKSPRTIDIDILLFDEAIIIEKNLIVPHPGMRDRKFVLLPLLELNENLLDPVSKKPFLSFLKDLPAQGIYPLQVSLYDSPYP